MRVLWHSQAPWLPYSFGQQTALVIPRLRELGFEVAISAAQGHLHGVLEVEGIQVYPGDARDPFGHAALQRNARLVKPDLVVTLIDTVSLGFRTINTGTPVATFAPLEHAPLAPGIRAFFEHSHAFPLAVTRHGEELLRVAGFEPAYTPHGIDLSTFRPQDRSDARARLGIPQEAFLVGMVAANRPDDRKSFGESLEAFARFRASHPEALLLLQTSLTGGTDLVGLADQLGIRDALLSPNADELEVGLITQARMAQMYSSLNVLLAPSRGEGFGLPLLEAQACGVPVITTDFGAMAEIGAVGWRVGGQRIYDRTFRSWGVVPFVDELVDALEQAYLEAGSLAEEAREHAITYDIDRSVREHLAPALELAADRTAEEARP